MKTTSWANSGTNAPVASGLTYKEQEEVIERVANIKAHQYRSIGFYDLEDLKQEVRLKCWEALENKYDPNLGTNLYAFLSVCAENRIRDIKRSVMYKHNKPCLRCPFWNAEAAASGRHDCLVYDEKMNCERFAKHERYVQAKLSASHPIDIDNERIEDECSLSTEEKFELVDFIETHLPSSLMPSFTKLRAQNYNLKALKLRERSVLITALKTILEDFEV